MAQTNAAFIPPSSLSRFSLFAVVHQKKSKDNTLREKKKPDGHCAFLFAAQGRELLLSLSNPACCSKQWSMASLQLAVLL